MKEKRVHRFKCGYPSVKPHSTSVMETSKDDAKAKARARGWIFTREYGPVCPMHVGLYTKARYRRRIEAQEDQARAREGFVL